MDTAKITENFDRVQSGFPDRVSAFDGFAPGAAP